MGLLATLAEEAIASSNTWMQELTGENLILCQITSQARSDSYAVAITNADFTNGGLNQDSNIRPNHLFTADKGIILYKAGQLKAEKLKEVVNKIIEIISDD